MKFSFFSYWWGVEDEMTPPVEVEQLTDSKTLNPCAKIWGATTEERGENGPWSPVVKSSLSALGRSTLNGQQGDNADIMRYAATQPNTPGPGLNDNGDDNWRFAIDNG